MGHILIFVIDRGPAIYSWEIVYLQAGAVKDHFTIAFQLSSEMIPLTLINRSVEFQCLPLEISICKRRCHKT